MVRRRDAPGQLTLDELFAAPSIPAPVPVVEVVPEVRVPTVQSMPEADSLGWNSWVLFERQTYNGIVRNWVCVVSATTEGECVQRLASRVGREGLVIAARCVLEAAESPSKVFGHGPIKK